MDPFDFSWMIGRTISVAFQEPATWVFSFDGSVGFRVDCPWRLLHHGSIAVSSDDHRQQFGLPAPIDAAQSAVALLAGTAIQAVEVRKGTADLLIGFAHDLRLEILPFSSGYESWQVSAPGGKQIIACGGGELAVW